MPSATLLGQSLISGLLLGGLYGLLALGLSLSWGLLRLVNLGHFALAFLGAYLTYQLGTVGGLDPWLAVLAIVPLFFGLGVALHVVFARFRVTEPTRVGPLFVPTLEFLACLTGAALAIASWAWLRFTYVGKALRASAEDPAIAAAFGVNHRAQAFVLSGVSAAYAGVAGGFIALISTLAPGQIWAWLGVVFAVVIIGGLGNPIGALLAGLLIGVTESLTMAVAAPAWAPLGSSRWR
jgi:branched-chain amino acid transport system permease protein